VRAASWDLSHVHLADPKNGAILCRLFPLDKHKNAQGKRASRDGVAGAFRYGAAVDATEHRQTNARQKYVADVVIETRLAQLG